MRGLQPIPETDFARKLTGLQPEPGQREYSAVKFGGIDKSVRASAGSLLDCRNLSARNFPALSPRKGDAEDQRWNLSDAASVFEWDGHVVVADDGDLLMDGIKVAGVTPGPKQFAVVNTRLIIWPDKKYITLPTRECHKMETTVQLDGAAFDQEGVTFLGYDIVEHITERIPMTAGPGETVQVLLRQDKLSAAVWIDARYAATDRRRTILPSASAGDDWSVCWRIKHADGTYTTYGQENDRGVYGRITGAREADGYLQLEVEVRDGNGGKPISDIFRTGEMVEVSSEEYALANKPMQILGMEDGRIKFQPGAMTWGQRVWSFTYEFPISGHTNKFKTGVEFPTKEFVLVFEVLKIHQPGEYAVLLADEKTETGQVVFYDVEGNVTERCDATYTTDTTSYVNMDGHPSVQRLQGTMEMTIRRTVPDMDYICASNNRLWGVSNHTKNKTYNDAGKEVEFEGRCIYASALGMPDVFWDYSGLSTDSYAVAVATDGDFTGICEYGDDILCFKEQQMFKVTGSYPSVYYLYQYDVPGVSKGSGKSLCVINETLYYLSDNGVYAYSGSTPVLLSDGLGEGYRDGVAATDGATYHLLMTNQEGIRRIYTWDTVKRVWLAEENEADEVDLCSANGKVMGVTKNHVLIKGAGTAAGTEWYAKLVPDYGDVAGYYNSTPSFEHKYYSMLFLRGWMEPGAFVSVEVTLGDSEVITYGEQLQPGAFVLRLPLYHARVDRIQVELSGRGDCTLRDMQTLFYRGSELR